MFLLCSARVIVLLLFRFKRSRKKANLRRGRITVPQLSCYGCLKVVGYSTSADKGPVRYWLKIAKLIQPSGGQVPAFTGEHMIARGAIDLDEQNAEEFFIGCWMTTVGGIKELH